MISGSANQEKILRLRRYFLQEPQVLLAFLFGSRQSSGPARPSSDWDVGVYLTEEDAERENKIWQAVEHIVGAEADLVVLNRAPAVLAWRILGQGTVLALKDRRLYLDLLLRVGEEADAFYRASADYYDIFQRSASLAEGDRVRLRRIIEYLEKEIGEYGEFRKLSARDYAASRSKQRDVEHWIEHLVNAVIDVGKIVLASERLPMPDNYSAIIQRLGAVGSFGEDGLCDNLAKWIKLRNILAHEYLDVRWKNISDFLAQTEPLWQEFVLRAKAFLGQSSIK